ncbi:MULTISPECIES: hypothetical protein [unclassified Sphingomonas]|uniref:hypothetical protein n=1 Tax=unclassified Sphingomonas TaxID=196159 RepID=UPI00226A2F77|nr:MULTISPECIES: hypothetical protein [unclassified Sphingomonas]
MATRALSADAGRASSEIPEEISAPSRRGLLAIVAGAGVGAFAINGPLQAVAPAMRPWDRLCAIYEHSAASSADYFETTFKPAWDCFDAVVGEPPRLSFIHRASNGHECEVPVSLEDETIPHPIGPYRTQAKAAARAHREWLERRRAAEASPQWQAMSKHMDGLYDTEDRSRAALMATDAPDAWALAFKLQLALSNDEMWEADREALLNDVKRFLA